MAAAAGPAIGGALGAAGSIYASRKSASSNKRALRYEQARFEAVRNMLMPFVQAGQDALGGQMRLLGLRGMQAQNQEIANLEQSPFFTALARQGEDAILQNASATGGLRGGNTQAALAQFRPQLLNTFVNDRLTQLGALSGQGLSAAGAVGGFSNASGNMAAQLQSQIGQAQSGGVLGAFQSASNAIGQYQSNQQLNNLISQFGGNQSTAPSSIAQWSTQGATPIPILD